MPITFRALQIGRLYTRPELAKMWGYKGYQALSRGAVTPSGTHFIILFITGEKQSSLPQYRDELHEDKLVIEGETNHVADRRIVNAAASGDEIHLFYRAKHHEPFEYKGQIHLTAHLLRTNSPSHFEFSLTKT